MSGRALVVPRAVWWAQLRAVAWFEVRAQAREPLTTLYVLVFGLLTMGYASSEAVELVRQRGTVPRTAPWALLLAFGGLTAFGQVITTMIATTAMLRDEAQRTRALVATSGLGPRTWFVARVLAALLVMLAVYAAMPLGTVLGTALAGGDTGAALRGSALAFTVITVPTTVTVTVVLAATALYTQRVLGVLTAALALVGLWQLALALVAHPATSHLGVALDPFGNAPVLAVTGGWTAWQRAHLDVPVAGPVLVNRLAWGALSLVVFALALRASRTRAFSTTAVPAPARAHRSAYPAIARATTARVSLRRFTAAWIRTDGGWRTVGALAVLNAAANAVVRPLAAGGEAFASSLLQVSEHARLFLILLATVYAGELVWRERDVGVQQLVAALPVSRTAFVFGRVEGLLLAQRHVVLPLALLALGIAAVRAGLPNIGALTDLAPWSQWLAWSVFVLWLPFLQLTVLSLTVHVLLDHKVAAHLLLITGWVLAVVLDGQGVTAWWLRFAEPAPLLHDGARAVAWGPLVQRGAYWSAVSAALLVCCWWRWPAGPGGATSR